MRDAHDRQQVARPKPKPKPTPMVGRAGGPDVIPKSSRPFINRNIAQVKRDRDLTVVGPKGSTLKRKVGRPDPVLSFLGEAAKVVGSQVKTDAKDWVTGVKKVAQAVDRYGDARLEEINPWSRTNKKRNAAARRLVQQKVPLSDRRWDRHRQGLVLSDPVRGSIIQAGRAFFRGADLPSIEDMANLIPKRGISIQRVPAQPGSDGVPGRVPWLVNRNTGFVRAGPMDASHGDIRRYLGISGPARDDWLEGWLMNTGAETPTYKLTLAAKGLDENMGRHISDQQGLNQLIRFLTRDVHDRQVLIPKREGGLGPAVAERQGRHRTEALMNRLGGEMTHQEMFEYIQSLPPNLRKQYIDRFLKGK